MGFVLKCSNGSLKNCREQFKIKGIGKLINSAKSILKLLPLETVISECIYDYDNEKLYNVLLFLIRANCKDEKILKELEKFSYSI